MKKLLLTLVSGLMLAALVFTGCTRNEGTTPSPSPTTFSAPEIKVVPDTMEIHKGDEIDLMIGVTVTDDYDSQLKATISDDQNFDANVEGTYVITYTATNSKGKTATAKRTVKVLAPLPRLVLEAQKALDPNWKLNADDAEASKLMYFANAAYLEYDASPADLLPAQNCVIHNKSGETIVVSMDGGGGEAVILDASGCAIEGRDAANGKLMNKDNPERVSSSVTTFDYDGETYQITTDYAKYMQIPAGGFAVVVAYFPGGNFDADGRSFINKNVLYRYYTPVKLYFEDKPAELLTRYVNHGPVVIGSTPITVIKNTPNFDLNAEIVKGLKVYDDNGTFDPDDDLTPAAKDCVTVYEGADTFKIDTEGTYTIKLRATDSATPAASTEFTRVVKVIDVPTTPTIQLGGDTYIGFEPAKVALNTATASGMDLAFYTAYYTGDYAVNGWGIYLIVDANGKIREFYDVWNNKLHTYDADKKEKIETPTDDQRKDVLSMASALAEGEYLVLGINGGALRNSFNGKMALGTSVTLYAYNIWPTIAVGQNTFTSSKVIYNRAAASATEAAKMQLLIYDSNYDFVANPVVCNGYGAAVVFDADGKVKAAYDGANGSLIDKDHVNAAGALKGVVTGANFYTHVTSLEAGEIFVIFVNDGAANVARKFALDNLRTFGAQATFANFPA